MEHLDNKMKVKDEAHGLKDRREGERESTVTIAFDGYGCS